ncbi:MAG TPA: tetratricopeptide repeat protein, partial [Sphingomicrobium sp.]|nr:tetratricopeptide repeat protein [Sphingomicrobium sp.]
MNRSLRFGTAVSALAMAGLVTGCATGQGKASAQAASAAEAKVGLATRAHFAMKSGDFAKAVVLSEQAVQASPDRPLFRALLGNAYFAAGRFASAEAAYRDSLSLNPTQPDVVLKLALAAIAQGRNPQALGVLEQGRDRLEAADYGLALALAGQPAEAVAVLDQAARLPGADARTRQNLALAHALSGDWTMARTIAAQDIAPEQLDSRIQQWMAMATPSRASDQVAALTGVKPAFDPGQPVRLALNKAASEPRMAQAAPAPRPVHVSPPAPVAYAAPEEPYAEPQPMMAMADLPAAPAPEAPSVAEAIQAEAPAAA